MPKVAPIMKVAQCETYGATVILHGNNIQEVMHYYNYVT